MLLAEVMAFLRGEAAPRIAWRRRAWLGRRAAFVVVERVVLARYWTATRNNDERRYTFVDALIDSLEAIGALDLISAARWAEAHEDAIEATRPAKRDWSLTTSDEPGNLAAVLNKPRRKRVG